MQSLLQSKRLQNTMSNNIEAPTNNGITKSSSCAETSYLSPMPLDHEEIMSAMFVLPRLGKKKHDTSRYPFSHTQLNGMHTYVCSLEKTYSFHTCRNPLLQQLFVCDIIHQYNLIDYKRMVIKFNEEDFQYYPCDPVDIYKYIREVFKNKKKKALSSPHLVYCDTPSVQPHESNIQNRSWWSLNCDVPYLRSTYHCNDHRFMQYLCSDYNMYRSLPAPENTSTYSLIHQFFNNTDLVVYNCSHRVLPTSNNARPLIHQCSKVRIRLEANCSTTFFIIFNSSLFCSHAESMYCSSTQYNTPTNPRFFSYVSRHGLLGSYKPNTNTFDNKHTSFDFCDRNSCSICKQLYKFAGLDSDVEFVLNAYDEHNRMVNSKKDAATKTPQAKSHASRYLVFGDLENLGWAVYRGVQLNANQNLDTLFVQNNLRNIIDRKDYVVGWQTIDDSRKSYNIVSSEVGLKKTHNHDILVADIISMNNRIEKRVKEIRGFENSNIYDSCVIINDGRCGPIQEAQRDIGTTECCVQKKGIQSAEMKAPGVPSKQSSPKRKRGSSSKVSSEQDQSRFIDM